MTRPYLHRNGLWIGALAMGLALLIHTHPFPADKSPTSAGLKTGHQEKQNA